MSPQLAMSELNQIMERGGPEVDALLETFKSGFLAPLAGGNATSWLNTSSAFDSQGQELDDLSQAFVDGVNAGVAQCNAQQAHSDNSDDGMPPLVPINTDGNAPSAVQKASGDDHMIDSDGDMPPLVPLAEHRHQTSAPPGATVAAAGNDDVPPLVPLSTPNVQSKGPGKSAGLQASTPSPSRVPLTRTVFPVDMDDLDDMPSLVTLVKSDLDVKAVPSDGTGGTQGSRTNKGRKNKKQRK
jgi:hypothetical protein